MCSYSNNKQVRKNIQKIWSLSTTRQHYTESTKQTNKQTITARNTIIYYILLIIL